MLLTLCRRIRISSRLWVIAATYSILGAAIVVFLISTGANKEIDFAQMEKVGDAYQRPLEKLLKLVPEHQDLVDRALSGDEKAKTDLAANEAGIDAAFDEIEADQPTLGDTLKFTPEGLAARGRDSALPSKVRKEWDDIKGSWSTLKPDASDNLHVTLDGDIRTMITHGGDMSNLILDPVLDSYYLCDTTLGALPQTQDRLPTVIREGEAILKAKTITTKQRSEMATFAAMLKQDDQDRITGDVQTSVNEDKGASPSLKSVVPPLCDSYVAANTTFVGMVQQIADADKPNIDPADFVNAGMAAREASFKMWDGNIVELDKLLDLRIGSYSHLRTTSYVLTACGLAVVGVFVFFLIRSVTMPLDRMLKVTEAIAVGDLDQKLDATSRDEIGRMEQAMNSLVTSIKDMQVRERSQAEELSSKVESILEVVNAASHGDLTRQVPVSGADAIGQLGDGLGKFLGNLRENISTIAGNAQSLASSSEELTAVSHQMNANAEETSAQAGVVSAATDQVNKNVQTVATAAEEMSASIKEISKNAVEAAKVANSAVGIAKTTNTTVSKLGESSREIGNVIKLITTIAQQTNLLALNATIEAARAGEAGKGFAVVANEVKELAKETTKATEDISQKISAIQTDTQGAVSAIAEIEKIIAQINDVSTTIASAVEEQTATTNEMTRNISEAAKGSSEIAQNITGVATAAKSTTGGASQTQSASQELSHMASDLQKLVSQFKYSTDRNPRTESAGLPA
jgi:methyl-accepting chemotaxis protein